MTRRAWKVPVSLLFLILAFPPFRLWPFAFLFLPLFLSFLKETRRFRASFFLAFLMGILFYSIHLHWLLFLDVTPSVQRFLIIGFLLLVLYESAYLGVFGLVSSFLLQRERDWMVLLGIPSTWVLIEFIRSFGTLGFPWVPLWYTQINNLSYARWASIIGPFGLSFLIILTGTFLFLFLEGKRRMRVLYLFMLLLFFSPIQFLGRFLPHEKPVGYMKVALFQPNVIPQYIGEDEWEELSEKYRELSLALKDTVDLIVFSESSIPGYFRNSKRARELFTEISKQHSAPMLLGSGDYERRDSRYFFYNSAILIDTSGEIVKTYRKVHLVPFGEWLPFEDRIPFLRDLELGQGNYSPGRSLSPLDFEDTSLGILICFESIFPEISREEVKRGAQVLINITSDGWYGRSLGPVEHFELARFRAIETNRTVVRCARTGISAVIDPRGRVIENLGLFEEGILVKDIPLFQGKTLYLLFGDWVVILAVLNLFGIAVYNALRKKDKE